MPNLVKTYDQVWENAKNFSQVGERRDSVAYERFASFQHWYHFSDVGEGVFAPSKFIGYQDTTLDDYDGKGSGGETERKLKRWFSICDFESAEFIDLERRLKDFAKAIDRNINAKIPKGDGGIHLPHRDLLIPKNLYADEANTNELEEGARQTVMVNKRERSFKARQLCLDEHGYRCVVCKLSFEERYGLIGVGFIHVHHLELISEKSEAYKVNPVRDLRPVCPNCHAMMHQRKPPISPEELAKIMRDEKQINSRYR